MSAGPLRRCGCWNITHFSACQNTAVKRCRICGDELCGACAKTHHAHDEFELLSDIIVVTPIIKLTGV